MKSVNDHFDYKSKCCVNFQQEDPGKGNKYLQTSTAFAQEMTPAIQNHTQQVSCVKPTNNPSKVSIIKFCPEYFNKNKMPFLLPHSRCDKLKLIHYL